MPEDSSVASLNLPPVAGVTPQTWPEVRARWLTDLSDHVYGRTPELGWSVTAEPLGQPVEVEGGLGRREQVRLVVSDGDRSRGLDVLLTLPVSGPSPVIAALNFFGNHSTTFDPTVKLPSSWVPEQHDMVPSESHRAVEAGRGATAHAWPIDRLLRSGFGLATIFAGDVAPDDPGHAVEGVLGLDHPPSENPWGVLGAWAWGLSAVRAHLATRADVQADAIVALGHSRMGKAALWAAAQDELFAGVASVQSGCGGAALTRRRMGESVEAITRRFPHWFTPRFASYADREHDLPVDQHQLLAAVAPGALYVTSAAEDAWSDPVGEYLATVVATEVHRQVAPPRVGYQLRPGGHSVSPEDWDQILTFFRTHLAARPS